MLTFELCCYLICGAIFASLSFTLCSVLLTGILQQCGYSERAFLRWYAHRPILARRYSLYALSLFLLVTLFALCFSFLGAEAANLISALPFLGVSALFLYSSRRALKVPLKSTGRAIRLTVCEFLLTLLIVFGLEVGFVYCAEAIQKGLFYVFRFVPITLVPLLMPLILSLASVLMKAYELPRNRSYLKKAKAVLENSACIKVGITGSYGKTSVKSFLSQLLSAKFRVIATPGSFNTPLGIARTVNNGLDCDVFLAELGARKTGDIQELCELVNPTYGIVTGALKQHLETFGSLEAIRSEKSVLAKQAKRAFVGPSLEYEGENALVYGKDFSATEVELSCEGTRFTLTVKGESVPVKTKLLGAHTAEDIAFAAALSYEMGLSLSEIAERIALLEPVPHRLERLEANGVTILDDSYNANTAGAQNAVEVLRLFPGKRYVVTPGIVELGEIEEEANRALGASFVGLDCVILVGETLVIPVRNGYLEAGGEEEKLLIVPTLAAAQEKLKEILCAGDCVLFLNDLPDLYETK